MLSYFQLAEKAEDKDVQIALRNLKQNIHPEKNPAEFLHDVIFPKL